MMFAVRTWSYDCHIFALQRFQFPIKHFEIASLSSHSTMLLVVMHFPLWVAQNSSRADVVEITILSKITDNASLRKALVHTVHCIAEIRTYIYVYIPRLNWCEVLFSTVPYFRDIEWNPWYPFTSFPIALTIIMDITVTNSKLFIRGLLGSSDRVRRFVILLVHEQ